MTRYESLVEFLRGATVVGWWAGAVLVPAWAVVAALSATVPGFALTHVPMTAPVAVGLPEGMAELTRAVDRTAEVRQVSGRLQLTEAPTGEALAFIGLWTAHKLVLLPVLEQLRALFGAFAHASPFRPENVRRLRQVGVTVVLVALARLLLEMAMAGYAMWAFAGAELGLWPAVLVSGVALAAGLLLVLLAEIFRLGGELEAEQAWTV